MQNMQKEYLDDMQLRLFHSSLLYKREGCFIEYWFLQLFWYKNVLYLHVIILFLLQYIYINIYSLHQFFPFLMEWWVFVINRTWVECYFKSMITWIVYAILPRLHTLVQMNFKQPVCGRSGPILGPWKSGQRGRSCNMLGYGNSCLMVGLSGLCSELTCWIISSGIAPVLVTDLWFQLTHPYKNKQWAICIYIKEKL